jgi:mannose-1-phosphate guanylyltransferase / phosphomannomutase
MTSAQQPGDTSTFKPLDSVHAIILAGEYHWTGSRFQELRPRPLLPVAQTPLVEHILAWLGRHHVTGATICANGSTSALRAHLTARTLSASVDFYQDRTPRGAAGCVKDAAAQTGASTLIVAEGGSIPTVDIERAVAQHAASGASVTVVVERRMRRGGELLRRPAGVYVFDRAVLEAVPATSFQDIKETLIPRLYRTGRDCQVFEVDDVSPRVMSAESYLALNHWMIARLANQQRDGDVRAGNRGLLADRSAWIDPDATVVGPVMLGAGVRVMKGATIVGPAALGARTIVAANALVARSVTWENCRIGERAIVDRSIVADDAVVDADAAVVDAVRTRPDESRGSWLASLAPRRLRAAAPHPGLAAQ